MSHQYSDIIVTPVYGQLNTSNTPNQLQRVSTQRKLETRILGPSLKLTLKYQIFVNMFVRSMQRRNLY